MHRQIGILGDLDHCSKNFFLGPPGDLGIAKQFKHPVFHCPLTILEAVRVVSCARRAGNRHERAYR